MISKSFRAAFAGVAVLAATTAVALPTQSITPPSTPNWFAPAAPDTNSSLILSVWDDVLGRSMIVDLGLVYANTAFDALTPAAGLLLDFGTMAGFSTLFGASNSADIKYTLFTSDASGSGASTGARISGPLSSTPFPARTDTVQALNTNAGSLFSTLKTQCPTSNPCVATDAGQSQYAGKLFWGSKFGSPLAVEASGVLGSAIGFYEIQPTSRTGTVDAVVRSYQNAVGLGQWLLTGNGQLTYSIPAVPLPAAAWLFLSGLVGLGAVARRRRAVA